MPRKRDNLIKQIEIIDQAIKDDEEKKVVLCALKEIIKEFTSHLLQIQHNQEGMNNRLRDVEDIVADLQEYVYDDSFKEELFGVCPYCGEEIPVIFKDDSEGMEIECPNCHNLIEVERLVYGNDDANNIKDGFGKIINFEEFKKEVSSYNKSSKSKSKKDNKKKE